MRVTILSIFILIAAISIFSCKKEKFINDNAAKLSFSLDTVMFDTVFTTIGSTTKQFKVYNPYDKALKLSSIFLAGGNSSNFRLNINGKSSNSVKDIELSAKDSMFIFVEVTVNPNNQNSPLVISDSIVFVINGKNQYMQLVAYGQDVNLINGLVIKQNTTWTNNKPFLVYNSMLVDSGYKLTIEKGTKLYFHKESRLYVLGTLVVNGTLQEQVYFLGDRLEPMYKDIPGQWDGIFLVSGSKENIINYAVIRNAITGIRADTLASLSAYTLTITNSKIENMSAYGIQGQGTTILAANCVINNCNYNCLSLKYGGIYEFYHCTVANYYQFANRNEPSVFINDYYTIPRQTSAYFGNCIIYGNKDNELGLDSFPDVDNGLYLDVKFDNCLVKIGTNLNITNTRHFKNYISGNPNFKDRYNFDFSLDTMSVAINKGDSNMIPYAQTTFGIDISKDIMGLSRTGYGLPDLGAYERKNQK